MGRLYLEQRSPNPTTKAIIAGNYTTTQNLVAQEMEILPMAKLTIANYTSLKVTNLVVAPTAQLLLEDNAQLLNRSPNVIITVKRTTRKVGSQDYTYFSSPVTGQKINEITDYTTLNYLLYNNTALTPTAYAPPRTDKFYYYDSAATVPTGYGAYYISGNWLNVPDPTNATMAPCRGYIVRGPQSFPNSPKQAWDPQFTGIANTGPMSISVPAASYQPCSTGLNALTVQNFIGNPYPSMLDADSFLSHPNNVASLRGGIYFWTHNTDISVSTPGIYQVNYTADDYVFYNLTGGIGTGRAFGFPFYAPNNSDRPTGKIGVCQGFFTESLGGSALFTDDMRDDSLNSTPDNQQFYKGGNSTALVTPLVKNRFWVSIEPASGVVVGKYKEALIGYMPTTNVPSMPNTGAYTIPGSENTFDKMYDLEEQSVNPLLKIYSLMSATATCPKLVIQGRKLNTPFNTSDVVTLGFTCPVGDYNIKAELWEGLFGLLPFYLRETLPSGVTTLYDIRTTPYFFHSLGDTDNVTRFAIVFAAPPVVPVNPAICGTTLQTMSSPVKTTLTAGATQYNWIVKNTITNEIATFSTTPEYFYFYNITGVSNTFYDYGVTYTVSVAPIVAGAGLFSNPCSVTTPRLVVINFQSTVCGGTFGVKKPKIEVNILGAPAFTNYRWVITRTSDGVSRTIFTINPNFYLSGTAADNSANLIAGSTGNLVGGFVLPNTEYCITVQKVFNFTTSSFGVASNVCCYRTWSQVFTKFDDAVHPDIDFDATVAPNPFSDNFTVNIQSPSLEDITIKVYDMIGKLVDEQTLETINVSEYQLGKGYSSGVYNIIVSQGENTKTLRVVKR